jgi:ribosomal protein L29
VLDSDHSRELEAENMRLTSGCMRMGRSDLGAALKSEIRKLAGGSSNDQEAARKHELACLRMAADCMQLVGDIRTPDLQRHFLELARLLTAAAESSAAPVFTNSI